MRYKNKTCVLPRPNVTWPEAKKFPQKLQKTQNYGRSFSKSKILKISSSEEEAQSAKNLEKVKTPYSAYFLAEGQKEGLVPTLRHFTQKQQVFWGFWTFLKVDA